MAAITINGNLVEPTTQQEGGSHFAADASQSDYILIHCVGRLENEQYDELNRLQVSVLQYITGYTYLCRYLPAELEEIRRLPYVVYANVYHPDFVITAELRSKSGVDAGTPLTTANTAARPNEPLSPSQGEQMYDVFIVLHPQRSRGTGEIKQELAERIGIAPKAIREGENRLLMRIRPQDLEEVARLDEVQTIEEIPQLVFHNDVARRDLKLASNNNPGIGSVVSDEIYAAKGEIIAVADGGIDDTHPAFINRIQRIFRYRADGRSNDTTGHGTHVAASAVGLADSAGFGVIQGTAPGAKLIMQSFDLGAVLVGGEMAPPAGPPLARMFTDAYNAGARIHTNSYGGGIGVIGGIIVQRSYDSLAANVDSAMKQNSELLIVFSAGNDGDVKTDTLGQIGSMAAAKNAVTVGACEPSRPIRFDAGLRPQYIYQAGEPPGNIDNVFIDSSRGPTRTSAGEGVPDDRRYKPDVLAPGVCIYSARTRDPGFVFQPAHGTNQPDLYGVSPDNNWMFRTGTSMAAPLVAGCCAVIRSHIRRKKGSPIPGALIKAVLINGAERLRTDLESRGPVVAGSPNNVQGFGRVNLAKSLLCITDTRNGGVYRGPPLAQGQSDTVRITIATATSSTLSRSLKVTMCYSDFPGTTASIALSNVLNLKVQIPSGNNQYGNTGTNNPDGKNNVQKVVLNNVADGDYLLIVECANITPQGGVRSQDFSLAWYLDYQNVLSTAGAGTVGPVFNFWAGKAATSSVLSVVQGYTSLQAVQSLSTGQGPAS